jgi:hypothetical protein
MLKNIIQNGQHFGNVITEEVILHISEANTGNKLQNDRLMPSCGSLIISIHVSQSMYPKGQIQSEFFQCTNSADVATILQTTYVNFKADVCDLNHLVTSPTKRTIPAVTLKHMIGPTNTYNRSIHKVLITDAISDDNLLTLS